MHQRLALALASCAVLVPTTPAQKQIQSLAGYGHVKLAVDVSAATTDTRCWGAEFLGGQFFVTADGLSGANLPPHDVYVFDAAGNFVRQFTQSPHTDLSRLGWFDLATDGQSLIGCSELGIHVFDTNGNLVNTVQAQNGPQAITQPITGPALVTLSIFSGVAFDPGGNGGNGSLWVGDSGQSLIEIDLQGNVLTTHFNLDNWFVRGIARDPMTGMLWINAVPHRGFLAEVDPATGRTTGRVLPRGGQQFPGGLGVAVDALGAHVSLVEFTQTDDTFRVQRLHLYQGLPGDTEPVLLADAVAPGSLPTGLAPFIQAFRAGDLLGVRLDSAADPSLNGNLAWLLLNIGGDATRTAVTPAFFQPGSPVFPEVVGPNPVSLPPANGGEFLFAPFSVGGQSLIPLPPTLAVPDGYRMRFQALYLHPGSALAGFMASNDVILEGYSSNIFVEAYGVDSSRPRTQYGFFRINHLAGPPIAQVTFDFTTSSNPGHMLTEFDTNANSMGFRFDGGNSPIDECGNTYRNGSDIDCGLLYDGLNTAGMCDTMADTGWQGSNPGNNAGDWRTLVFRFAPNTFDHKTFAFDCDTDQGPGVTGGAHAGMVVTIQLQDGTVLTGELVADPADALRAFRAF